MEPKKLAIIITSVIVLVLLAIFYFWPSYNASCVTKEMQTVNGVSMAGIVENGQNVTVLDGYYRCNKLARDDVIIYNFSGDKNPLIKSVKGIPGDTFSLEQTASGTFIDVDGKRLMTSDGQAYTFDVQRTKMLSLYVDDYHGVIPQNSAIILGNIATGSVDSSQFGLVSADDIIGKVSLH